MFVTGIKESSKLFIREVDGSRLLKCMPVVLKTVLLQTDDVRRKGDKKMQQKCTVEREKSQNDCLWTR